MGNVGFWSWCHLAAPVIDMAASGMRRTYYLGFLDEEGFLQWLLGPSKVRTMWYGWEEEVPLDPGDLTVGTCSTAPCTPGVWVVRSRSR